MITHYKHPLNDMFPYCLNATYPEQLLFTSDKNKVDCKACKRKMRWKKKK